MRERIRGVSRMSAWTPIDRLEGLRKRRLDPYERGPPVPKHARQHGHRFAFLDNRNMRLNSIRS